MTPESNQEADSFGADTARFALSKAFAGDVSGETVGTMLSVGAPGAGSAGAYVAVDRFVGTVDGKSGGFVLIHRGTMSKSGAADLEIMIAPDSGTGDLDGIAGKLSIEAKDGTHLYNLAYNLPVKSSQ